MRRCVPRQRATNDYTELDDSIFIADKLLLSQDLLALRSQMGGQVNVEVDSPAQEDLSSVLASIRDHYETVASKNRRDVENWFQAKVGEAEETVIRIFTFLSSVMLTC